MDSFVEKPDEATAQKYLDSGEYAWNAGMFVAPAELMLKHLAANEPELHAGIMQIADAWDSPEREDIMERVWGTLPKTAIDYAVAEPAAAAGDVAMVPGSFSWDDVGDFDAVARLTRRKPVRISPSLAITRMFLTRAAAVLSSQQRTVKSR